MEVCGKVFTGAGPERGVAGLEGLAGLGLAAWWLDGVAGNEEVRKAKWEGSSGEHPDDQVCSQS